jgi:TerC family integral membrane protein
LSGGFGRRDCRQLQNQYAIAVAEKPVPLSHGLGVRAQNQFATRQGSRQHQQGRTRQVKVRQQRVHDAKLKSRPNEEIARAGRGARFASLGRRMATPLMVVLVVVETTDLVFAVDSIPAVLAITHDPFIVYTSNVFAILGLRALYFALAGLMGVFNHLHYGLSAILVFVGLKMIGALFVHIPIGIALGAVVGLLAISIATSIIWPPKETEPTG